MLVPPSAILVRTALLIVCTLTGFFLRLYVCTFGHNFDVESYSIVASLIREGHSVYAHTERYNYGPIWAYVVGALSLLCSYSGTGTIEQFHLFVAGFLSIVDLLICRQLLLSSGRAAAIFFILNPVSILVTGYHSQFDNLAILFALFAWDFARKHPSFSGAIGAGIILGLSLSTKHIFLAFLPWLPFIRGFLNLPKRCVIVVLAFSAFLMSFAPWWGDPASQLGILNNVIHYRSLEGNSLLMHLINLALPIHQLIPELQQVPQKILFLALVGVVGLVWIGAGNKRIEPLPFYLLTLCVFTSAMANQYLVIPIVACAMFPTNLWGWCYTIVATQILLASEVNLGARPEIRAAVGGAWLQYLNAQVWLLFLFIHKISQLWYAPLDAMSQHVHEPSPLGTDVIERPSARDAHDPVQALATPLRIILTVDADGVAASCEAPPSPHGAQPVQVPSVAPH